MIGIRSVIGANCQIANTIVMGADSDESPADRARNAAQGIPDMGIGAQQHDHWGDHRQKTRALASRVCITNKDRGVEADETNYYIRDGIVVVPKDAVIPAGTVV